MQVFFSFSLLHKFHHVSELIELQSGAAKKVQYIVTDGGAFPTGARIIRAARKQVNFFGTSCQRSARLDRDRVAMDLPSVALANFPETRVAFIVILFRSLLANSFLLQAYSGSDAEFNKLRTTLSEEDQRSMQEMEAVMSVCFEYATNESQQSRAFNNSLFPWYRKALLKSSQKTTHDVMVTTRQPGKTQLKRWPREPRKV